MKSPLLSIVIANYNYGRFLEEAIQSVLSQSCQDFELIIVDGGSADNSVEIIKKYQDRLTWWCSEPDGGQSDAFNKGFSHARGRYGCWLNADDILMSGALMAVKNYLVRHPRTEWLCGSSVFVDAELRVKWCSRCVRTWPILMDRLPTYSINGPSSFFTLDRLRSVGGFDVRLRYTMDTDLWRRFVRAGMRPYFIKDYVWCFRVHEESKTSHKFITGRGRADFVMEGERMNARYGISSRWNNIGARINQIYRLLSGTYFWSYVDTRRFKGSCVEEI